MSSSMMQLVERQADILEIDHYVENLMATEQSTADFFTRDDRKELARHGFQMEQVLKDLGDLKATAAISHSQTIDAIEKHESRLRTLEDERLVLRTQMATSWRWIALISGGAGFVVSLLMKLIWK